ncbi:hypothetical protein FRB90_000332 [Tulasnella sp. 427]|nr:hypothetical protein FRB90_000332 [Tulasnella sp. 427]
MKVVADANVNRVLELAVREAKFLVDLSHENVIQMEGIVEDTSEKIIWLVFPWAGHGNLFTFVNSRDWEIPERISLIYDAASGIQFLHSRSPPIIHGDLKLLNVLVTAEYRAIITDFGSARRVRQIGPSAVIGEPPIPPLSTLEEEEEDISAVQMTATKDGVTLTVGKYTLRWAAPELLNENRGSLACDIWSLGWIAYEVIFGRVPFHDVPAEGAVIWRVLQGDLPCLTDDARMTFLQALSTLMMQCWSLDPDRRPKADDCMLALSWMPRIVPAPSVGVSRQEAREAELNMQLGRMYLMYGDYQNARDCYTTAIAIFTSHGPVERRIAGVRNLAEVHRLCGEDDGAIKLYSEALKLSTDTINKAARASALWGLAGVHLGRKEYDEAFKLYSEALQIWTYTGDRAGRAKALRGLALVYHLRNEHDEAAKLCAEVLQISTEIGNRAGRTITLWNLAEVHRMRKEYDEAAKLYSESLQIRAEIGLKPGRAGALWGLAEVHRMRNEYDEAARLYSEALQTAAESGDRATKARALGGLAEVHRMRKEYDEAIKLYSEALQLHTDTGNRIGEAGALWGLADIHRMRSQYDEALKLYSEALQLCTDIGDKVGRAHVLWGLADIHRMRSQYHEAARLYSEALQLQTDIGDEVGKASAQWGLAEIQRLQSKNLSRSSNS